MFLDHKQSPKTIQIFDMWQLFQRLLAHFFKRGKTPILLRALNKVTDHHYAKALIH